METDREVHDMGTERCATVNQSISRLADYLLPVAIVTTNLTTTRITRL